MSNSNTVPAPAGYLHPRQGINWRSIIGFELAWLTLVYFQNIAVVPVLVYFLYGFYLLPNRARLAVVFIALAGIAIDAILVSLHIISFSESLILPGWFLLLWALFALAAVETMAGFLRPWWLGILLGASGGPLSYLGGAALSGGVLQFPSGALSFLVLVGVWGLLGLVLGYSRRFYAQTIS